MDYLDIAGDYWKLIQRMDENAFTAYTRQGKVVVTKNKELVKELTRRYNTMVLKIQ